MFLDYILEGADMSTDYVSEATMEEINSIVVPDYSNSTESPFELMEKSIYEFAKTGYDTMNAVSKIEIKYLRENGIEPVWEASDAESIFSRFKKAIKTLIGKLGGLKDKLFKMIDDKIDQFYAKAGNNFDKRLKEVENNANYSDIQKIKISYNIFYVGKGQAILEGATDIISLFRLTPELAPIYAYVFTDNPRAIFRKEDIKPVDSSIIIKKLLKDVPGNITDNSSARKAVVKMLRPGKQEFGYKDIKAEVQKFKSDPRASKTKATINKTYNTIVKKLGTLMDFTNKYEKQCKKNKDKASSSIAGALYSMLNVYSTTVAMVYKETISAATSEWLQSLRLMRTLLKRVNSVVKKSDK